MTPEGGDTAPTATRPVIEKVKTDRDVIHLNGHEYGEVMTLSQRVLYRMLWWTSFAIGRSYFRLDLRGLENVPLQGACIISPIHRSNLETPMISQVTKRRLRYMGKESLWKTRFGAWLFTTAGGFPVERATADRTALRACMEVLERGEPLVMFPEGTRQTGPKITEMFDGPAYLAIKSGAPIIPVGFGGTERALSKRMRIPKPKKCVILVGEPIYPPAASDGGRARRSDIKVLTDQIGGEIQRLFDEAQELAGDPNR